MHADSDVLIVGGGVIGVACGYYLTERGAKVTLIDKGDVGFGCSYGNAGLIVPSHSFPLPMPGVLHQAGRWLLSPDSPFYIKPRLSWSLMRWLLRFVGCSTKTHLQHAAAALAMLAQQSRKLYGDLAASKGAEMHFQPNGGLYVCNTRAGLDHAIYEMEILGQNGVVGRALDEAQLRELEPAVTGHVVGGTYYEGDAHAEPLRVVKTLAADIEERGATLCPRTELLDWQRQGQRITAVETTRGTFRADQVIVAGGSWSPRLVKRLGLNVPIQAGKGYGVTVEPFQPMPKIPALLSEVKVGVTPRQASVRLAGTMELSGLDESVTLRRVNAIVRGARQFFSIPEDPKVVEVWRGLRPCTPDGLPIIGRHPNWENLTLAAGHAMLGLTLAAATGQLVADLLTDAPPSVDPTPFRPDRF